MATCRFLLIGPPRISKDGRSVPVTLRKALALAAYLAVEQRPFSREYLATLLWPDHGQESALANLRRNLSLLRDRLGNGCIASEADALQIDPDAVTVDVDEFQSLLGSPVSATDGPRLEAAAELYRGSFLEGFSLGDCEEFNQWQDVIREQLRSRYDALLEALTARYLGEGRMESALDAATKWLELDHLNEAAHRALMEIHARSGRPDRAHRQFESCVRMLRDERLEPDDLTLELNRAIETHRIAPGPHVAPRSPRAGRRRRIGIAAILILAAAIAGVYLVRAIFVACDLSVAALEMYESAGELSSVRFALRNEGRAKRSVDYAVVFSSDPLIVTAREYVVYADVVRMERNSELTVLLDRWRDIQEYLDTRNVVIPAGDYTVSVVVDPNHLHRDLSWFNNRLTRSSRFFFPGTAADAAFAVEIAYSGPGPLDHAHPLEVYIGARSSPQQFWDWGRFMVTRPGTYHFPVEDVPRRDRDGSGYFLAVVHAGGGNRGERDFPLWPEQGEVAAIYREGPANLTYGVFGVSVGTPVYPGRRYAVEFAPPPLPGPDAWEVDNSLELGTVVDYDALPVRQHHTLHHEGTGDTDADWFRIMIRAGDSLTVETFSAGGLWECDTAIDIADSRGRFIRNAVDKSDDNLYSLLTYRNDTGTDQMFHVLVKPYRKYDRGVNVAGEYIVEFRR